MPMLANSGDCYRYGKERINGKDIFFKEYKAEYLSKERLEIYHALHHYLSSKESKVYFGDIVLDGEKINRRKIKILDLDPQ